MLVINQIITLRSKSFGALDYRWIEFVSCNVLIDFCSVCSTLNILALSNFSRALTIGLRHKSLNVL